MKITCQSCQAKYTIADEKVAGKTVKIKCKKCGATIVVNGNEGAAAAMSAAPGSAGPGNASGMPGSPQGEEDEGDGATRVFSEGGPPSGAGGPDEWTVNIADDDQRTLTGPQMVVEWKRGVVKPDTYVWKDGMSDWLPVSGVPELMRLMTSSVGPAAGGAAGSAMSRPGASGAMQVPAPVITNAPAPLEDNGLGGTMIMNEPVSPLAALSPAAAAAASQPAAARRNSSAKAPAVDLFASGQHERSQAASGASAPVAAHSGERQLGERNENSVLFSISALTAAAGAGKGGADPFDLGPSGNAPKKKGRNSGVDDIMNLGGGGLGAMGGAPMLAPPPLLSPIVEMPAPPPVAAPVAAPSSASSGGPAMSAVPAMRMDQFTAPPPKSKAPMVIGVVGLLVVLGGVGAFFATKGPASSSGATAEGTSAPTTTAAPVLAAAPTQTPSSAAASPTAVAQNDPQKPADTTQAGGTPANQGAAGTPNTTNAGSGKPTVGGNAGKGADPKPADTKPADTKPADTKPADTKPADPKPADTKPEAKPDPGGGGKEFDRAAAMSALSGAAGSARGCKKDDGPTGTARVKITFAPSGSVTSSSVDGAPFAGTSVGGCIAAAFKGVHVPSFDGSPVTVNKSISIN